MLGSYRDVFLEPARITSIHLHYNLLQLHYGQHPLCTAQPFTNEQCRHGSHAKPLLTWQQMRLTATT